MTFRSSPRGEGPARAAIALWVGLLVAAATAPEQAAANANQQLLMEDDHHLLQRSRPEQLRALDQMQELGVDKIRAVVWWRYPLADRSAPDRPKGDPTNPASDLYSPRRWAMLDSLVRETRRRGIALMLNPASASEISGTILNLPHWARLAGGAPRVRQFAKFVRALGRRYNGVYVPPGQNRPLPRVGEWSIWNEPNGRTFLSPQWRRVGEQIVPWSPVLYRRLYVAAARALRRSGHRDSRIYLAETASAGLNLPAAVGSMAPGLFVRELACVDSELEPYGGADATRRECEGYRRLDADGLTTHFYSAANGTTPALDLDPDPDDWTAASPGRPTELLRQLAAGGRLPPDLPVYNTEAGFQWHPVRRPLLSAEAQAANLNVAEFLQWRDPNVASFAQYLIYDDPFWNTGLRFIDGPAKPAYFAFRMPIVVRASGYGAVEVWGAANGRRAGPLTVILVNGLPLRTITPQNPRGYFSVTVGGAGATVYQLLDPLSGHRSRLATATPGL